MVLPGNFEEEEDQEELSPVEQFLQEDLASSPLNIREPSTDGPFSVDFVRQYLDYGFPDEPEISGSLGERRVGTAFGNKGDVFQKFGVGPINPSFAHPPQVLANYERILRAFTEIEASNNVATANIIADDLAMLIAPEVMFTTVSDQVPEELQFTAVDGIMEALSDPNQDVELNFGFTNRSFEESQALFSKEEGTGAFFAEWGKHFRADELDLISHLLLNLNAEDRNQVSALAIERLRNTPLATEEDRFEFLATMFQWVEGEFRQELAEDSTLGRIGNVVSAPFRFVTDKLTRGWAWAASPDDFAHRQYLSVGQNVAVSAGSTPGDSDFVMKSGTADFLLNLSPADPLNLLAGAAVGFKAARNLPRVAELSRGGAAIRALVPFTRGAGITDLPAFSRGTVARVSYSLMSRTVDQMLETRQFARAAERMAEIDNIGRLVEEFPQLADVAGTIGRMVADTSDPGQIKDIIRYGFNPVMDEKPILNLLEPQVREAELRYRSTRAQLLDDGVIGVNDLNQTFDGVTGELLSLSADAGPGVAMGRHTGFEDGEQVFALTSNMRHLDLADTSQPATQQLLVWLGKQAEKGDQTAASAAIKVAKGNVARGTSLRPEEQRLIARYAEASNLDSVKYGGNSYVFNDSGWSKGIIGPNRPAETPTARVMSQEITDVARQRALFNQVEAGRSPLWVIRDLPRQRTTVGATIKGPWTRHASNNSEGWWGNFRRSFSSFMFHPDTAKSVNLHDVSQGRLELSTALARLGGTRDDVNQWVDAFVRARPEERFDIVGQAMNDIATRRVGHPLLAHGLISWSEKLGDFTYAKGVAGNEIGLGASRTAGGTPVALPIMPSHLSDQYVLPGKEFWDMIRRFKQTNVLPNPVVRGVLPGTRKTRGELMSRYRGAIARQGNVGAFLDDEMLAAIAYSDMYGIGRTTGAGAISKAASVVGRGWDKVAHVFSVAQLAFRPFAWASRVVLEEQVRAELFNLPSMFKNPVSWMRNVVDANMTISLSRHAARQRAVVDDILNGAFLRGFSFDAQIANIERVIPDFRRLATERGIDLSDTLAMRGYAGELLSRASVGLTTGGLDSVRLGRSALRRSNRIRGIQERIKSLGFDDSFNIAEDVPDILNRHFSNTYTAELAASTATLQYAPGQMSRQGIQNYGRGYGRILYQMLEDPVIRTWVMPRLAGKASTGVVPAGKNVEDFVHTSAWARMRPNVQRIAQFRSQSDASWAGLSDLQLAQRYLDDIAGEYVEAMWRPFWGDRLDRKAEITADIAANRGATVRVGDSSFVLRNTGDNYEDMIRTTQSMVDLANRQGLELPATISAFFDPRFGQFGNDAGMVSKLVNNTMHLFGELTSQTLSRRPAWMSARRRYFEHYSRLGWDADIAGDLADKKATEIVNHVFFNMGAMPRFFNIANDISPFFSAMWEVAQTWAYKIPTLWGPAGYPILVRKVDRIMDGLNEIGLLTYGEKDEQGNRQAFINFDPDGETGNPLGDALSRAGHAMLSTPVTLASHLGFLRGFVGGEFEKFDFDAAVKDDLTIAVGTPLNPFDTGFMAVTQLSVGLNPPAAYLASQALPHMPWAVDARLVDSDGTETLAQLVERLGVDQGDFLQNNYSRLVDTVGRETANRIMNQDILAETFVLPAHHWEVPGTSVAETLIDQTFFPFGREESVLGTLWGFTPAWSRYAFRGLGMWEGGAEDGDMGGFLSGLFTPSDRWQMGSEINTQLQHLEASEGLITRATEAAEVVQQILSDTAGELMVDRSGGAFHVLNPEHPRAQEFQDAVADVERLNAEIVKRANNNAAGASFFRGLMGFFAPSTPRSSFEADQRAAEYWTTREWVEGARARGSEFFTEDLDNRALPRISGPEDLVRINSLIGEWLADDTGDRARAWLRESYPEIMPFIQGTSFWGAQGPPVETEAIDEFFDQVENGQRLAYPPDVMVQRLARANVAAEREFALLSTYGSDPAVAAQSILSDWSTYRRITQEHNTRLDALDWMDSETNDGGYLRWAEENFDDMPTLLAAARRDFDDAVGDVDDLLSYIDPADLTREEYQTFRRVLQSTTREIRDQITAYDEALVEGGFQNPREKLIGQYFEQVATPYYEALDELYSGLETATTGQERSVVFESVKQFRNGLYMGASPTIGGVPVPTEQERYWNSLSSTEQQSRLTKAAGLKPEWLDLHTIHRLVDGNPALGQYLPTDMEQQEIYTHILGQKLNIQQLARTLGANGEPLLTNREKNDLLKELENELYRWLIDNGRGGEAYFAEAWPIQRLGAANLLPPAMQRDLAAVNEIRGVLDAMDKGPTSEAGRQLWLNLNEDLLRRIAQDPGILDEYRRIGDTMYDEDNLDAILPRFWYGQFVGQLG